MMRTRRSSFAFDRPFNLSGFEDPFPAGVYELVTDEELIEGLSFTAYRRVASWLLTPPSQSNHASQMIAIDPLALSSAHERDHAQQG